MAVAACLLASWLALPADAAAQTPVTGLVQSATTTAAEAAAPVQQAVEQVAAPVGRTAAKRPAATARTTVRRTVTTAVQTPAVQAPSQPVRTAAKPAASTVRTAAQRRTAAVRTAAQRRTATRRTAVALQAATTRIAASLETTSTRLATAFDAATNRLAQASATTVQRVVQETAGDLQATAQLPSADLVVAGAPVLADPTGPRLERDAPMGRVAGATAGGDAQRQAPSPVATSANAAAVDTLPSGWGNRQADDSDVLSQATPAGGDRAPASPTGGLSLAAASPAGTAALALFGLLALLFLAAPQLSTAVRLRAAIAPLAPFMALSGRPG